MTNFYSRYTVLVPEDNLPATLEQQATDFVELLQRIPAAEVAVLHPPYTWTLLQVIGHIIDGERIFAYRALRIARGDQTVLPGFDENAYAETGEFQHRTLVDLIEEFQAVRQATTLMFRHLPKHCWDLQGSVNGTTLSVRELAQSIIGHIRHHSRIIRDRLKLTN